MRKVLKKPPSAGRPNSLLKAAAPSGASSIMSRAEAICDGLPMLASQGCTKSGMRRSEVMKPARPAFGLDPRPVAPSSLISPPDPVAAPGYGDTAVGWLCVSTLIRMSIASSTAVYTPALFPSTANLGAEYPSITAALSSYAEIVPADSIECSVFRIIPNKLFSISFPSIVHFALKILCRQCSELT